MNMSMNSFNVLVPLFPFSVPKKKGSGKVIKGEDREEIKKQKDQL